MQNLKPLFLQYFTYAHHVTLFLSVISLLHLLKVEHGSFRLQMKFLPFYHLH